MKMCYTCAEEKDIKKFGIRGKYVVSQCKSCVAKRAREWYRNNKSRSQEYHRKKYEKGREKILERVTERYWNKHEEIRKKANDRNKTPEYREKSRIYSKYYRENNKDKVRIRTAGWKRNNPEKALAHQYVLWALRLNVISKPDICQDCKEKKKVEAHHTDYAKPLEVEWLCKICHTHRHYRSDYVSSCAGEQYIQHDRTEVQAFNSDSE